MNFGLSDEQQMIVDTTRAFVENELYPHEAEVERTGHLDTDLVREIHQAYLDAGADVVETNTFTAGRWKLEPYGLQDRVSEIHRAGASIAVKVSSCIK